MQARYIHKKIALSLILGVLFVASCRKFIDVGLAKNLIDADLIFKDDATATGAVLGIYGDLKDSNLFGNILRLSGTGGLCSDEMYQNVPSTEGAPFELNEVNSRSPQVLVIWSTFYKGIYQANAAIEGLTDNTNISEPLRSHLLGEAYFMRAFLHFYVTSFFDEVPLILTTDYEKNSLEGKASIRRIYDQMIADLQTANSLLPESDNGERFRPTKPVLSAFLARLYLYDKQWAKAEEEADKIIANADYQLMADPNEVFLFESKEPIWRFGVTSTTYNTSEARYYVVIRTPIAVPLLRNNFVSSFEPGDARQEKWIGQYSNSAGSWYFPYKYKINAMNAPITEYFCVLGLSEQYLIRAEARIQQDRIEEGIADLNALRAKRRQAPTVSVPSPLPDLSVSLSKADALLAVEGERKHELFAEWAHRWFDLKRTGRADAVLGPFKGANWQSSDVTFPIPQAEVEKNPSLRP